MKSINTNEAKFRSHLKEVFEVRMSRNPNYSLRSFAKSLDINPATLSQILNGKRPITKRRIEFFIQKLELNEEVVRSLTSNQIKHKELTVDYFTSVSEWFYDGILELTHLKGFVPDVKWVSKKLGISYSKVSLAVERLKRLEFLKISENSWIDDSEHNLVAFDDQFSNSSLKRYQKQILEKSLDSIDNFERGERDHTSFLLSMDDDLLDDVHEKIKEFQKELVGYIEENSKEKNKLQVIHFGSFPITTINKNKDKL